MMECKKMSPDEQDEHSQVPLWCQKASKQVDGYSNEVVRPSVSLHSKYKDGTVNNLDEYIQVSTADVVANIGDLVTSLFSSKLGVMLSETQFENFFSLIHQQ
ncbi:hypothetical protein QJS10_CPA05g00832 [Acorus calamus]|uniref:Uncharacterized protein n=1 Tax=Acorus calamus TaxID=4465 RepID=A0AAV9ET27_ACOCL|nr:hypothetical protein QJS10_CPA05g00832 [Acorus calamus]